MEKNEIAVSGRDFLRPVQSFEELDVPGLFSIQTINNK